LKVALRQTEHHLQHLSEEEEALRQKTVNGQELRVRIHSLETGKGQLEKDITDITEKLHLLLTEHGARCPLCETELGIDRVRLIEDKFTTDKEQKAGSLLSVQNGLTESRKS